MTSRQTAVLASRIFCVWFIYSAILDLSILPNLIAAVTQSSLLPSVVNNPTIGSRIERTFVLTALGGLFRLGVNVASAMFFYRCGPGLIRFLTGYAAEGEVEAAR